MLALSDQRPGIKFRECQHLEAGERRMAESKKEELEQQEEYLP